MKKILIFIAFISLIVSFSTAFAEQSSLGSTAEHSFSSTFYSDSDGKYIILTLPNKKTNTFTLQSDFSYSAQKQNGLSLTIGNGLAIVEDEDDGTDYLFSFEDQRLIQIRYGGGLKVALFYDDIGNLQYATDNESNTLFFMYNEEGFLDRIEDIYGNILQFNYGRVKSSYVLTDIKFNESQKDIEYTKDLYVSVENKQVGFEFVSQTGTVMVRGMSEGQIVYNPQNSTVFYKYFGNSLYALYGTTIYKISTITGAKTKVLTAKNPINDFFISEKGIIYVRQGQSILRHDSDTQKFVKIAQLEHVLQFVVSTDGKTIYYINTYHPGVYVYDVEKKETIVVSKEHRFGHLEMQKSNIIYHIHTQLVYESKNPEFDAKYDKKLESIAEKVEAKGWTPNFKESMRIAISKYIRKIYKSSIDEYKKEEIVYILQRLQSMLQ